MDRALMFLIKLAWDSRIRLPLLVVVGFLAFDIRMQLEINIQTRRIRRGTVRRHRNNDDGDDVDDDNHSRNTSESSDNSWTTIEEYEVDNVEMIDAIQESGVDRGIPT